MEGNRKTIKIPAVLDRYSRKKDRSYSLTFNTSLEIGKKDREAIDEMWQNEGWLLFVPNETKEIEIPKEDAKVKEAKPMQRLVARMYVFWQKKKKDTNPSFSVWLEGQAESLGQQYLDMLQ